MNAQIAQATDDYLQSREPAPTSDDATLRAIVLRKGIHSTLCLIGSDAHTEAYKQAELGYPSSAGSLKAIGDAIERAVREIKGAP